MSVKGKIAKLAVIVTMMTVSLFSSCKNGMQDMVNALDEKLVVQVFKTPEPGEEGFEPGFMLSDQYLVGRDATLCLFAPKSMAYEWKIYRIIFKGEYMNGIFVEYQEFEEILIEGIIPVTQKNLVLYIPDLEDIFTVGTYKLVLTVKDNNSNEYTDTAALVIYEPYYSN